MAPHHAPSGRQAPHTAGSTQRTALSAHRAGRPVTRRGDAIVLLGQARDLLIDAERSTPEMSTPEMSPTQSLTAERCAAERFRLAHLAALRISAAVFAERGRPAGTRRRLVSAWVLLRTVAPELAEWGVYFAAGAAARAAVEAGAHSAVSPRQADDQLRAATDFLHVVEGYLGLLPALAS